MGWKGRSLGRRGVRVRKLKWVIIVMGPQCFENTEEGWGLRKQQKVARKVFAIKIAIATDLGEQGRHFHTGKIRKKIEDTV